ncbi:MAG: hypothetical protein U0Y68_19615 [Blastocatellia bacterium]
MMKRTTITVILLLGLISLGRAQDKTTTQKVTKAKNDRTFADTKMVVGKVAEVNDSKLVIENPYGAKREIKLDTNTKFQIGKRKNLKAADMTNGMTVNVFFREADNTATVVAEKDNPPATKK